MRDLVPTLPALVLPPIGGSAAPRALADLPGLASDVERRFLALEDWCSEIDELVPDPVEFCRLADRVNEAVQALADAPAGDLAGLVTKARLLTACPAIVEDELSAARVGASLARDVLRLLGAPSTPIGGHHA